MTDLKKTLSNLYAPSTKTVSLVTVPAMSYLMIDGKGNPNTSEQFRESVSALYTLAYTIRAISKEAGSVFTVMPLEGLWSSDKAFDEVFNITSTDKDHFIWTLMILQPHFVMAERVEAAREQALKKGKSPLVASVRFECYDEGEAVQMMHIGSFDAEGPNIARLHAYIAENGWHLDKRHHEIYLSDFTRVSPEKLRTIIRQPFVRHD
jgi:hypothetical protein